MYVQRILRSAWASTQADRSLLFTLRLAEDRWLLNNGDSDQIVWVDSPFIVIAWCTIHIVGFVM